jgi:hypothetical protein
MGKQVERQLGKALVTNPKFLKVSNIGQWLRNSEALWRNYTGWVYWSDKPTDPPRQLDCRQFHW